MPMIPENQHAVVVGTPKVLDFTERLWNHAVSFCIKPGVGGTVVMEVSNSPLAVSDPTNGANIWVPDSGGTINAVKEISRFAPCKAIRFTAAVTDAVVHQKG